MKKVNQIKEEKKKKKKKEGWEPEQNDIVIWMRVELNTNLNRIVDAGQ